MNVLPPLSEPPAPHRIRQGGSALLITLFFVALLTILIIGFLSSMELETTSARSHLDGVVAQFYSQMAADTAVARLSSTIGNTNRFWVSQPGRLYVSPVGTNAPVTTVVDLSSGVASRNASADQVADLNPPSLRNAGVNLIAYTNLPMSLAWIYQRQDGTLATNQTTFDKKNPVVGRFAYWIDDESAKINVNTAWSHTGNTNEAASPSQIDLAALNGNGTDTADTTSIRNYVANRHFNSLDELKRAVGGGSTAVMQRFSLTHYNHSPDLNMFGEPRILLTTQKRYADAMSRTNFLDILTKANDDPGTLGAIDPTKTATVVANLVRELSRSDWPLLPGASFAGKYPGTTAVPADVTSVALNIVEWVRSTESTNNFVEPLRGSTASGAFKMSASGGTYTGNRIPASRRPCIVELGAYVPAAPVGGFFNIKVKTKIYFPPVYNGAPAVDLTSGDYAYYFTVSAKNDTVPFTPNAITSGPITASDFSAGTTTLTPGNCATLTRTYRLSAATMANIRPTFLHIQPTLMSYRSGAIGNRFDIGYNDNNPADYQVDPASVPEDQIKSFGVDDPFANQSQLNWIQGPLRQNTLASATFAPLHSTLGTASTTFPQQDTDSSGLITAASVVVPAPAGTPGNLLGRVQSVAELGFIHTGMYSENSKAATPWRTLRLQPSKDAAAILPDWAILDLFSVPLPNVATADQPYFLPNTSTNFPSVGGRINLNAIVFPFVTGTTPTFTRTLPLQALLLGTTNPAVIPFSTVKSISTNIVQQTLATGSNPGRNFGNGNFLYTPAQVCEIKGVADGGEASEALTRQIVDLGTTRSGVFSIYTFGQSLKQDSVGTIHVLGEQRRQIVVERVVDSTGKVSFKPIYNQDFSP